MFGGGPPGSAGAAGVPLFQFVQPQPGQPGAPGGGRGQPANFNPFQMFLGGPGGGAVDPQVLAELVSQGVDPFGFGGPFQEGSRPQAAPDQGQQPARIPTAASAMKSLAKIKVTKHDIEANESTECSICLDDLVVGQPATRIPCGHLYHEDCVKDWLKKSNECPVCRYELPTDNAEYERGRRMRMAGRKLRMRHADLACKSAQELTRLATHIGVDITGCLEKSELVERIASSPKVEIIPVDGDGADARPDAVDTASSSSCGPARSSAGPAPMDVDESHSAPTSPSGPSPSAPPSISLDGKSVSELKKLASRCGVSLDGCLEKYEIVQRIKESPSFRDG